MVGVRPGGRDSKLSVRPLYVVGAGLPARAKHRGKHVTEADRLPISRRHLRHPVQIILRDHTAEIGVMVVAAIGIVINAVTAWLFASDSKDDINLRGAFLHMASDALVSAGAVVAVLVILLTSWLWLDPVVSLAINAIIIWGTWGLLRDSFGMSMAAVPVQINPATVREFLSRRTGVVAIHNLHVWPMSTTEIAMTCHLEMPAGHPGDAFLHDLAGELATRFKINHPTVQIEIDPHLACALASDDIV
jgi:cobalt-zinc-cadmium efflux system protein